MSAPSFNLWPSGKPKRIYKNSNDTIRCPKCKNGTFDKKLYEENFGTTCRHCGTLMKPTKTFSTIYSGKPEIEHLN